MSPLKWVWMDRCAYLVNTAKHTDYIAFVHADHGTFHVYAGYERGVFVPNMDGVAAVVAAALNRDDVPALTPPEYG